MIEKGEGRGREGRRGMGEDWDGVIEGKRKTRDRWKIIGNKEEGNEKKKMNGKIN